VRHLRLIQAKFCLPSLMVSALFASSQLAVAQTPPAPASTPAPAVTAPLPATSARYLAANCANCHGTDGRAQQGGFNLAGLPKDYIVAQMAAFKSGTRQATIMHQISKGYSDAQIALMADYFSKQKVAN
jgi:cytochrome subunit of sulfide dehydrogenase